MTQTEKEILLDIFRRLPKIDLHCHLPGCVRESTMIEFSEQYGFDLPTRDPNELKKFTQVSPVMRGDLNKILQTLDSITSRCFVSAEAIERIAFEMIEDAWLNGVVAVEARFSPSYMASRCNLPFEDVVDAAARGLARAQKQYPVEYGIILGITRQAPLEIAQQTIELAIDGKPEWKIVGVDLSGKEADFPPEKFISIFEKIRKNSRLGITVHAGEAAGPGSVYNAIKLLGANRIGHGVRAVEDLHVIDYVKSQGVTLETCPTSNVLTGAVNSFEEHPVKWLLDHGVAATINSDDPSWFNTNMVEEFSVAYHRIGLTFDHLFQSTKNAAQALFTTDDVRKRLADQIKQSFQEISGNVM